MKYLSLQKLGGISIILGSVLLAIWTVCRTFILPIYKNLVDYSILILNPNWIWICSTAFVGIIFLIFGFTAAYSRMYDKTGVLGLTGYCFIILAYLFQAAKVTWEIFIYPLIAGNAASLFLLNNKVMKLSMHFKLFEIFAESTILIGVVLFCISIILSNKFSKLSGVLFLCGALAYGVGPMINIYIALIGVAVLSSGCFLMGYRMIIDKAE